MNLTEIRAKIRTDLANPDKDILTPDMIDRAVDRAVSDLSRFFPREQIYDATLVFEVADESFTSSFGTWVNLANNLLDVGSETVTTTDKATTYTRDTDYTMDYASGMIKILSTGSMSDATEYYISYTKLKLGCDISSIATDLIRVSRVEYPAGNIPQTNVSFSQYGNYITVTGSGKDSQTQLSANKHMWIHYLSKHTSPAPDAEGSYPNHLDDVVILGAIAYSALSLSYKYMEDSAVQMDAGAALIAGITTILNLADTALDKVAELVANADSNLTAGTALINTVPKGANAAENYAAYAEGELNQAIAYISEAEGRISHANGVQAQIAKYESASSYYADLAMKYRERSDREYAGFVAVLRDRLEWKRNISSVPVKQGKA